MKQENAGQADLSCIFVLRKHGLGKGRVASWMKRIRKKEIQKKQKCIPKQSVAGSRVTCLATPYFAEDVIAAMYTRKMWSENLAALPTENV